MKNILFPTDFSDNSWNALVYILKLYAQNEVLFHLLHTTNDGVNQPVAYSNDSIVNAEEELLKFKAYAEVADANANHNFNIILSSDPLENAIASTVKKFRIDLVAMGTKGATTSKNKIISSTSVRVIQKMKLCPILVIPETYDYKDLNEIALVTDFNEPFIEKDLYPLKNLENYSNIRIVYFALNEELNDIQKFYKSQLESLLSEYDYSFHMLPETADKISDINAFIEEFNIDIIVFVNSKLHEKKEPHKESLIKKIGFQPRIPFLVIQE